jgi:tetratricopeptide (TPR) repeat protein
MTDNGVSRNPVSIMLFEDGRPPADAAKTTIIFGINRGGTSAIAGLVRGFGFYLGPDLPVNNEDPSFTYQPIDRMKATIEARNADHQFWGWKFPRAVSYLDHLLDTVRNPMLILVVRDVVATALGLVRWDGRDQMSAVSEILDQLRKNIALVLRWRLPTLMVSYEKALARPDDILADLEAFLERPAAVDHSRLRAYVQKEGYKSYEDIVTAAPTGQPSSSASIEGESGIEVQQNGATTRTSAGELWQRAKVDHGIILDPRTMDQVRNSLEVDDVVSAINIGIVLRENTKFDMANDVFGATLQIEPENAACHYNYSHSLLRSGNGKDALYHAGKATLARPDILRFRTHYVRLLAAAGDISMARDILNSYLAQSTIEHEEIRATFQFGRYLKRFPEAMVEGALREVSHSSSWQSDETAAAEILKAIRKNTPFALVRLGDGEGAWTFLCNSDEADYPDLYRANRGAFLRDWFCSEDLLYSTEFGIFARNLAKVTDESDIIGIPDEARIRHEYRILSQRGVPSSVNLLRLFGLLGSHRDHQRRYTSNGIHWQLARRSFFGSLFREHKRFGVITSHRSLPELLRDRAAIDILYEMFVPGDSRNVWVGDDGLPVVQFPNAFKIVHTELEGRDLSGIVFLVAAGFVGKQYLHLIKQQGGIALDIGAIANRWAANASPL